MSTFYLLPPRPVLGRCVADALIAAIPGLDWTSRESIDLADLFSAALARRPDAYVVYREELPEGEEPGQALIHGFGANVGDDVVELRAGIKLGEVRARRWRVGGHKFPESFLVGGRG